MNFFTKFIVRILINLRNFIPNGPHRGNFKVISSTKNALDAVISGEHNSIDLK